jgi:Xaa-Pro dipeptidase
MTAETTTGGSHHLDRLYLEHVAELGLRFGQVLAAEGWDGVAIHSGISQKRSRFDDQFWPLRACPHFQHWVALSDDASLLILRPGRKPILVRASEPSFWERSAAPESEAFQEAFDVVTVRGPAAAKPHIGAGRLAFVGENSGLGPSWGLSADAAAPPTLLAAMDALRTTKTPYEVACITEANRRARSGHEALRDAFRAGDASELDLHLLYLRATCQDDAETPYKNIVAIGENAATLHHVAYGRRARSRSAESLLVDAGATCRGYCSDVTRTYAKGSGAAASVFGQVVKGVDAMQQRLCAAIRVGMPYEALHEESHRQVAAILRDVGILRGPVDAATDAGVTRAFYPHGLGHSLGLQTHDVGCGLRAPRRDNPYLRNTSDIAAGQVLTIEPGIYFIEALLSPLRADTKARAMIDWALVEALAPLGGVRIEDDVHVLGGETRNLTREQLPQADGA